MADQSPKPQSQDRVSNSGKDHKSNTVITQEQIRAIADRVYAMLLRDIKYEWERHRSTSNSRFERFRGGM